MLKSFWNKYQLSGIYKNAVTQLQHQKDTPHLTLKKNHAEEAYSGDFRGIISTDSKFGSHRQIRKQKIHKSGIWQEN
jgi:hypothetical protein